MSLDTAEVTTGNSTRRELNPKFRKAYFDILRDHLMPLGVPAYYTVFKGEKTTFPFLVSTPFGKIIFPIDSAVRVARKTYSRRGFQSWWVPQNTPFPCKYTCREISPDQYTKLPFENMETDILRRVAIISGLNLFKVKLLQLLHPSSHHIAGYALCVYENIGSQPQELFTLGYSVLEPGTPYVRQKVLNYGNSKIKINTMFEFVHFLFDPPRIKRTGLAYLLKPLMYQVSSLTFQQDGCVNKLGKPAVLLHDTSLYNRLGTFKSYVVPISDYAKVVTPKNRFIVSNGLIPSMFAQEELRERNGICRNDIVFPNMTIKSLCSPYFVVNRFGKDMNNRSTIALLDPFSFNNVGNTLVPKIWYITVDYFQNYFRFYEFAY